MTPGNPFSFSKFVKAENHDDPASDSRASTSKSALHSAKPNETSATTNHASRDTSELLADILPDIVMHDSESRMADIASNPTHNMSHVPKQTVNLNDSFESLASSDSDDFVPKSHSVAARLIDTLDEDSVQTVILEDLHGLTKPELIRKIEKASIFLSCYNEIDVTNFCNFMHYRCNCYITVA